MKKIVLDGMQNADTFARRIHTNPAGPLSANQLDILFTIANAPEPLRPSALADVLTITRPFVTKNLAVLVRAGYVTKVPDTDDGRSFTLALTRSGTALSKGGLAQNYYRQMQTLADELGKKKFAKLIRMLAAANEILVKAADES